MPSYLSPIPAPLREEVASLAAEVIEQAARLGLGRWGATPYREGIRINVGWTEILTALPEHLALVVDGEIARAVAGLPGVSWEAGKDRRGYYPSIPGSVLAKVEYKPRRGFQAAVAALRPALRRAVELAGRRRAGRGVKEGHDQDLVREIATALGRDLPSPLGGLPAPKPMPRIKDLRLSAAAHPKYERAIIEKGWFPLIFCDSSACYWNGSTIRAPNGDESGGLTRPGKEQLIRMMQAGYFGALGDVVLDERRWGVIYDHVRYKRQTVIDGENLRTLERASEGSQGHASYRGTDQPTTGPQPSTWSAVTERDASQPACTYVFRFGERNLWKVGLTTNVERRLAEVNAHVPHEVLGERWEPCFHQEWPDHDVAYRVEQRLLTALRRSHSVAERVIRSRKEVERAWEQALADHRSSK